MANNLTSNPWVVDTTATLTADLVRIARVRWVGGTTAGHTAVLTDTAGHVVWASAANGANFIDDKPLAVRSILGLICTTLASGKLYIEFM